MDEDGFTVVVRGGRYGRTGGRGDLGSGSVGVGVAARGTAPKVLKGGAAEMNDFYKFQKVDRKRKGEFFPLETVSLLAISTCGNWSLTLTLELADLRKKFDQDKAKVEELKRSKRFKPY